MAVDPYDFETWEREQQRTFLRKFKRPIGARAALGKKYLHAGAIAPLGAAIEKRGRKALRRLKNAQRGG